MYPSVLLDSRDLSLCKFTKHKFKCVSCRDHSLLYKNPTQWKCEGTEVKLFGRYVSAQHLEVNAKRQARDSSNATKGGDSICIPLYSRIQVSD